MCKTSILMVQRRVTQLITVCMHEARGILHRGGVDGVAKLASVVEALSRGGGVSGETGVGSTRRLCTSSAAGHACIDAGPVSGGVNLGGSVRALGDWVQSHW
jgi:hypothetical protein